MFKAKILRLLKDSNVYRQVDVNDPLIKSVINSPYINTILTILSLKLKGFNGFKHHIDGDKFERIFHPKIIVITNIQKEEYNKLKDYLFNNGIIWCNKVDVHCHDDFFVKHDSINLYIDGGGMLSYSSSKWRPSDFFNYTYMDLEEFYNYFEMLKIKIKNNIHLCVDAYNINHNNDFLMN